MGLKVSANSTVFQVWLSQVKRTPQRKGVIDLASGKDWTLSALQERVSQAATDFSMIKPGARIAFGGANDSEWLVRFLAIQMKGGIALALDPMLNFSQRLELAQQHEIHFLWEKEKVIALQKQREIKSSIAFEKLTSGSTGVPKRIPWSHTNLLKDGEQILSTMGIRPSDRQLGLIPLGHSYGMGSLVMPLILQGTCMALASAFVPTEIPDWIQKHQLTFFPTVPVVLQSLLETPSIQKLGSLRTIVSAGARLEPSVAASFYKKFGKKIHNFYGSTETGGIAYDRTGSATARGEAIGKPLKGVKIRFDCHNRIIVKSPAVARRSQFFKVADLGQWNHKGELVLMGRVRPMINVGGKKIDLAEIEGVLRSIHGIREVWVGVVEQKGREHLIAAVETDQSISWVMKGIASRLPDWKTPKKVLNLALFPRTSRGKVDGEKIREFFVL